MIQKGTYFKVGDNSGAKVVACIHVGKGYRKRYARLGDVIIVSVKSLRTKRRKASKIKKGDVLNGLIVRTKVVFASYSAETLSFFNNSIVLLNDNFKFLGTRVFGPVPFTLRGSRFLRVVSLAAGAVK